MKIRNGFVSNSSSSSFVILGNIINIHDISPEMILEKNIYVIGGYLNEGQDVFKIENAEMLAFLYAYQEIGHGESFEFIDTIKYVDCEAEYSELDLSSLPKTGVVKIISGDSDYRSSTNINDLQHNYDSDGVLSVAMTKYMRKEKVKKIEKK